MNYVTEIVSYLNEMNRQGDYAASYEYDPDNRLLFLRVNRKSGHPQHDRVFSLFLFCTENRLVDYLHSQEVDLDKLLDYLILLVQ